MKRSRILKIQPLLLQGGATLVIFIAILFLMVMLSMHIQDGNIGHQKFTHNLKEKSVAKSNAAYATRYAQSWIQLQKIPPWPGNVETAHPVWNINTTPNFADKTQTWWNIHGKQASGNPHAKYVIQQIYSRPVDGNESSDHGFNPIEEVVYKITAKGKTSGSEPAHSFLESTFIKKF